MNMQAKLGNSLLKSLVSLHEQKGQLLIEDVGALLQSMAGVLQPEQSPAELFLRHEIEKIANYIHDARRELAELSPPPPQPAEDGKESAPAGASQELDAVLRATEKAASTIMDAADEIQSIAGNMGSDPKSAQLLDISARIYEACTFQDLTGQRLVKVLDKLNHTDEKITRLVALFSNPKSLHDAVEGKNGTASGHAKGRKKAARPDEHLMNGPQLPGHTPTQAEIDAMFNDLKE